MTTGTYGFEGYLLDPADRRLSRDGVPLELNARYLDALALLVREQGRLVSKDRFLEDVWRGVPVTDEALTQCIKTLRRLLGDAAANPRFIETVPKHGYRFIAPVVWVGAAPSTARSAAGWVHMLLLAGAGIVGGGIAGILCGLLYAFGGASQPLQPGMGAASVLLVLVCLAEVAALIASAGIALGIAAAGQVVGRIGPWSVLGGALGGLIVGAFAKLVGLDAFTLLFGQSPGDITGAPEGALIGAAVGLGAWLGSRGVDSPRLRRGVMAAGLAGAGAGLLIPLLGGRMLGGSLDLLARQFPYSRLRLDHVGAWFAESGFGPVSQAATGAVEGALFAACIVAAMTLARRSLDV